MNRWARYGLWGVGGLAGLWVLYRAFLRPPETVEGEGEAVPLLTPSIMPGQVAGVSEFPSQVGGTAGVSTLDLLKFEREDRALEAAREDALRKEGQERRDERSQQTFLRRTWGQINRTRIQKGQGLLAVCVRPTGGLGVGKQCKGAAPESVYGGQ